MPVREADFYEREGDPGEGVEVRCGLCSHRCRIKDGKAGICGVRWNRRGVLITGAWERVIARHVDPIEKKPLYHFLPGTASYSVATTGCNFRCGFCQNWQISQHRPGHVELPGEDLPVAEAVADALRAGCATIAYTYTEPTVYFEYALAVAREARARGIANVFVTNGYQSPACVEAMEGLIDAANVDLKSFREPFYKKHCKAHLEPVLGTLRALAKGPVHLEVTTLLVPGENDSREEVADVAGFLASLSADIPWHVSRFHPDFEALDKPPTPVEKVLMAVEVGKEAGLRHVYAGNLPGREIDTLCPSCDHVVIRRSYMGVRSMDLDGNDCPSCGSRIAVVLSPP
ncbi:MAG: AmmeMemoRadiSam system radical SAM enzyme [Planctomycetota bacterium]|jgi:pyruvate formate lyase activating enzyme